MAIGGLADMHAGLWFMRWRQSLETAVLAVLVAGGGGVAAPGGALAQQPDLEKLRANVAQCRDALQGKISTGLSTNWPPLMLERLCDRTDDWQATVDCYQEQMNRHGNANQAVPFCRRQRGIDAKDRDGKGYGIASVMTVVNHTRSDQYLVVLGRSVEANADTRFVGRKKPDKVYQHADVYKLLAGGEIGTHGVWSGDRYIGHSVYVTTNSALAYRLKSKIDAYAPTQTLINWAKDTLLSDEAAVLFEQRPEFSLPAEIDLNGEKLKFDAWAAVGTAGTMAGPRFLSIEGDTTATQVRHWPNLFRARKSTAPRAQADNRCMVDAARNTVYRPLTEDKWYDADDSAAVDRGCGRQGERIFEVRCEPVNKTLDGKTSTFADACKPIFNRRPFQGRPMTADPLLYVNNSIMRIAVSDPSCPAPPPNLAGRAQIGVVSTATPVNYRKPGCDTPATASAATGVAAVRNTAATGPRSTYLARIDFCHSALADTNTGNNITIEFLRQGSTVGRQTISGSVSDCGALSKGYLEGSISTAEAVDAVRVSTDGGDAMFVDQVEVWRGNAKLIWEGRNNGGGWCLSTDANDFRGGWEANASGACVAARVFNNRAG
jgi:hypothetical protein